MNSGSSPLYASPPPVGAIESIPVAGQTRLTDPPRVHRVPRPRAGPPRGRGRGGSRNVTPQPQASKHQEMRVTRAFAVEAWKRNGTT
jgi:hypothetical protein